MRTITIFSNITKHIAKKARKLSLEHFSDRHLGCKTRSFRLCTLLGSSGSYDRIMDNLQNKNPLISKCSIFLSFVFEKEQVMSFSLNENIGPCLCHKDSGLSGNITRKFTKEGRIQTKFMALNMFIMGRKRRFYPDRPRSRS